MTQMSAVSAFSPEYSRSTPVLHRRHVYYSGRVQGVGFRYTAKNLAMRYDISGYVRNLPDGRVELIVEGPDDEIEQLLAALSDRMTGYIRNVESAQKPAMGEFSHFHIRH
jgi:acylphosphatase